MLIRSMKQDDLDEVVAIENKCFSIPWAKQSICEASQNDNNIYLVAVIDGHVAGYIGVWAVLGEGNITNVAVDEKYRRMGVAKELLAEMEKMGRSKNIDVFFLEVRQSNTWAIRLYESFGFKNIGVRKKFYEKPTEDALIMSKIL